MGLAEFIGFIISMLALLFLAIKRRGEERHRREHPQEALDEEREQEQNLREFLKSINIDPEKEETFSPISSALKTQNSSQNSPSSSTPPKNTPKSIDKENYYHQLNQGELYDEDRIVSKNFRKSSHREVAYEVRRRHSESRASHMLKKISSPRQLFVFKELLDKPKAIRNPSDDFL